MMSSNGGGIGAAAGYNNRPVGRATARAPGVCGELVQGILDGVYYLVTCPIDFFSRVTVELHPVKPGAGSPRVDAPDDCAKTACAVAQTLLRLDRSDLSAKVSVGNPIPRSKGMGSSSADLAAAITATGLALGTELEPETVAEIALGVEPTDGVMVPGLAMFDHREGRIKDSIGRPPPMEIVALDFGGTVDTLEFNQTDRGGLWREIEEETTEALELVRAGVERCEPALIGRGATISAWAGQRILPKTMLPAVADFAKSVGAVGVNVGHSGTIIGVLLDARPRRGKSAFRQAREAFPEAEMVHHFRLLGGGVQTVEAQPIRVNSGQ